MNLHLDLNTILVLLITAGLARIALTLWKTVLVVERLDERTSQHEKRLDTLEQTSV